MANGKISSTMATEIGLDVAQSVASLKSLESQVKSATMAWKAQESSLKSVGDYLGASQAKFEGLGHAVEAQQSKIDELKRRQDSLNTSNKEEKETYEKLQVEIDKATTKLNGMTAQQEKAKQAYELQKSGVIDLSKEIQQATRVNESYIERLKAEGKEDEALRAKKQSLSDTVKKQQELYQKEEDLLKKIEGQSGKTSDAYAKQQIKVNDLGKHIATTSKELSTIEKQSQASPGRFFTKLASKMADTNKQAEKTSKLGNTIKGVFGGTLLAGGVTSLAGHLKAAAKEGFNLAAAGEQSTRVLKELGASDEEVKNLKGQISELRNQTGFAGGAIGEMQKTFFGLTKNVDVTKELTKGIAAIGVSAGLSSEETEALAGMFVKIDAGGKLASGTLAKMEKSAHGVTQKLADAAGVSKDTFSKMVDGGQITSKKFEELIQKIGGNNKIFEEFGKTGKGVTAQMEGAWTSLKAKMMAPLVSSKTSGLDSLNKVLQSQSIQKLAEGLGKAIAKVAENVGKVMQYIASHQQDLQGIVSSIVTITKLLAEGIWNPIKNTILAISNAFSGMAGNSKKAQDPLKEINKLFDGMKKHQQLIKDIGGALVAAFAVSKLMGAVTSISKGIAGMEIALKGVKKAEEAQIITQKAMNNAMKANIFIGIAAAVIAIGVALIELYKHNKKFRDFINGLVKPAKEVVGNIAKFFKNLGKDIDKTFGGMMKSAGKIASDIGKVFGKMGEALAKAGKYIFKTIGPIFKDGFAVIGGYVKFFSDLFTGNWKDLGKDLKKIIDGYIKFFKDVFKGAFKFINDLTGGKLGEMFKKFQDVFGGLAKVVGDAIGAVHHTIVDIARAVIKPINFMLEGLRGGINWVLEKVGADKIKAKWEIELPKYARGTGGHPRNGLAVVNDSPTTNFREMYRLPNGKIGLFPNIRNMIVPLEKGTEILDGDKTQQLLTMFNIPAYSSGIGGFFSDIFNGAKDLLFDVGNILLHPVKFLQGLFNKFVHADGLMGVVRDIVVSFPKTLAEKAVEWIKGLFAPSTPSGSGAERWRSLLINALKMNGLPDSATYINAWLRQINTESGGNEKAIGGDDGLADGNAMGLLQTKPGTFAAYSFPGHGNIMNGFDNMLAAINYAKNRYGASDMLQVIGLGHGYENGGLIARHGLYEIAERNRPEFVIPMDAAKRPRAYQLLGQVVAMLSNDPQLSSAQPVQQKNNDLDKLSKKLDRQNKLMEKMIFLQEQVITTILQTALTKDALYKRQAQDLAIREY